MTTNNPTWGRFHPYTDKETATLKPTHKAQDTTEFGDRLNTHYKVKVAENRAKRRNEHRQKLRDLFARERFCVQCGKGFNYCHLSIDNMSHIKLVAARTRCDECTEKGNMPKCDSRFCHACGVEFQHQGIKQNARELVVNCATCRAAKEVKQSVTV